VSVTQLMAMVLGAALLGTIVAAGLIVWILFA
jgi:hypothetical protein